MRLAIVPVLLLITPTPSSAQATAPVALSEPASAAPGLATPKTFVVPEPKGEIVFAAGATSTRIEDKVAIGKPTAYRLTVPAAGMYTIGVSAPKGGVRLALYRAGSTKPLPGSEPEAIAIRFTTTFEKGDEIRLVAIAEGAETPFRFEVSYTLPD
jgi:hypothetical protein